MADIFCCYALQDRDLWLEFRKQLISLLYYQNLREEDLYACSLQTGIIWGSEVYEHLCQARILVLLISADFMASDYRTRLDIERLQTRVVPVILRPVHWQVPPLKGLQEIPKNKPAITLWGNQDQALYTAADELGEVLDSPSKANREKRQLPVVIQSDPALPALHRPWPWENYDASLPSLVQHMGPIASLTLSSEAVLISDGRDQRLLYWYISGKKPNCIKTLAEVEQPVYSVAFSPDASFVASGGADNQVLIWNPYTGEIKHTLKGHTGPVSCVAFSPDGQMVASASDDQTIRL
ncbi:MAG TPA: hypothetical protein VFN35_07540, partial [Ktedonobacteraceae bacterium]|nr:hypothetical protein [Ktedonobacteraceae bacterium]